MLLKHGTRVRFPVGSKNSMLGLNYRTSMSPLDRASNQKQNTLAALFETPDPDFGAVTSTLEARDPSHVTRATQPLDQRKGAVLKYIRSVHTKNLTSVSEEDIRSE